MAIVSVIPNSTGRRGIDDPRFSRWRAFAPPFEPNARGVFAPKGTRNVVWASILHILLTPLGSRIMLPSFGSKLPELLWEPNDQILKTLGRQYIFDAIEKWEPRVQVIDASVVVPFEQPEALQVAMSYTIKADGTTDSRTQFISRNPQR